MRKLVTGTGAKLYRNVGSYAEGKEVWEEVNIASGKPTMHEDEVAFRAKIIANPDDDTVRLVFADWLQENGQEERAEFIRVQCRIADRDLERPGGSTVAPTHRCKVCRALWVEWPADPAKPPPLQNGSWSLCSAVCGKCCDNAPMGEQIEALSEDDRALVSREWELLSANAREWANAVIPQAVPSNWSPHDPTPYLVLPGPSYVNIAFVRGFVFRVTCTAADWLAHGDAIRAREPVVRVIVTTRPETDGDEDDIWVVGDPAGVRIPHVDVLAEQTAVEREERNSLAALFRCRWRGLKSLSFPWWNGQFTIVDDPVFNALVNELVNERVRASRHAIRVFTVAGPETEQDAMLSFGVPRLYDRHPEDNRLQVSELVLTPATGSGGVWRVTVQYAVLDAGAT